MLVAFQHPLTSTLVWALPRISAALFPDELSTQDLAPYSIVTGMEVGSRCTRCNIGLLAHPSVSDMARKPISPLGEEFKKGQQCRNYIFYLF